MQQPRFSLSVITPPAIEPVLLADVKPVLRVDDTALDAHLTRLITMARQRVEDYTSRSLINTTWSLKLDWFPLWPQNQYYPGNPSVMQPIVGNDYPLNPTIWAILVPRAPLASITAVNYYDLTGTLQTMDPSLYIVDPSQEPARVAPFSGGAWPGCQIRPAAVDVRFVAGYGATADTVPAGLITTIISLVGMWFDNPNGPGEDLPESLQSYLSSFKIAELW